MFHRSAARPSHQTATNPRRRRRSRLLLAALAAGALVVPLQTGADLAAAPAASAAGQLVWADEFNGAAGSAPNPAVWTHELGASGWGNNELQNYVNSRSNSAMDGTGNLVITARRDGAGYTSARLATNDKVELQYGRIEASIKIPRGQGIWPAFWMLGAGFPQTSWPNSGEIDIMENIGREPHLVHGTVHGPGYSGANGISGTYQHPQGWSFADTWHTFAIDWKPGEITWFVDGQQYHRVTRASVGGNQWVFDQKFFLILNLAVGGDWPGYPDGSTQFPQQMFVDYIHVFDNGSSTGGGGSGLPTGTSAIRATANTGLCLDVPWADATDTNRIQLAWCNGNAAQSWTRGADGSIRALGKCLDVARSGTANGTVVWLYTCNGTGAQKWTYDSATRALKNPQSGKCLDATNGAPLFDGQKMQLYTCNQTDAQRWSF
ncbi:family 16 glycosylhydrolase [Homoserinibacter gongjuensis]|uniref:Hydrolase n=1 Tax=Homoserinibacter gongjuensis TaxID=1162968 RepID=A0ABQ6JU76_9MICO|nr:family 16 glycosylhydrolase [Homoserinibacter gongjuensis]GMA90649.1 hydrolase [Homoserinibacter gongjuensis]